MSADEVLIQIEGNGAMMGYGFCATLVARHGLVVETAPYLRFMRGWSGKHLADYCARKGWTWRRIDGPRTSPEVMDATRGRTPASAAR